MQPFTQAELRFLAKSHGRTLPSVEDVDFSDCPEGVFNSIMERRARRLGRVFEAFRREQAPHVGPLPTLHEKVAATKLF